MPATISKFEDAIQNLIALLKGIATGSGYQTDVKDVKRVYQLPHRIPDDEMPFIGVAGTTRTKPAEQVTYWNTWKQSDIEADRPSTDPTGA